MKTISKNSLLLIIVFVLISFLLNHNSKIQQKLFPTYCSTKNLNSAIESPEKDATHQKQVEKQFVHVLDCISCLYFQEESSDYLQVGNIWIQQAFQKIKKVKNNNLSSSVQITGLMIQQIDCYEYKCQDFHYLQDFSYKNIQSKTNLLRYGFQNYSKNLELLQKQCPQNESKDYLCWKSQTIVSNKQASSLILRHRIIYNSTQKGLIQQIPRVVFKHTVYSVLNSLIVVVMWFMILIGSNYKKVTKNMSQSQIKVFIFGVSTLMLMLLIPFTQKYASGVLIGLCMHYLPLIFYDIKCLGSLWIIISIFCVIMTETIFFQQLQKITDIFFVVLLLLYGIFSKLFLLDRILIILTAIELVIALIVISMQPELNNHIASFIVVYSLLSGICAQNCELKSRDLSEKVKQLPNISAHQLQERIERQLSNNQNQMII